MSSMLGAPLGGTTRGGHHGFELEALMSISPPNFGGWVGRTLESSDSVAEVDPGVPVTSCALAGNTPGKENRQANEAVSSLCVKLVLALFIISSLELMP